MEDRCAARWFAVRAEFEQLDPLGRASLWLRELGHLFTLGLTGEARRFCDVLLVGRADDEAVVVFRYKVLSDATQHAYDLVTRLDSLDVDAFCVELDLDPGALGDPVTEVDGSSDVYWVPVPKHQRKRYWPTGVVVVPE
jgi:hypothetical protein